MSAIQQFKSRLQKEGFHVNNQQSQSAVPQQGKQPVNATNKVSSLMNRSQSQVNMMHKTLPMQKQAHYQDLSRKAIQPSNSSKSISGTQKPLPKGTNEGTKATGEAKKKISINAIMMNPIDSLSSSIQVKPQDQNIAANNQMRENDELVDQVKELNENLLKVGGSTSASNNLSVPNSSYDNIRETLAKMNSKIASAQRKMNFSFNPNKTVSTFEPAAVALGEKQTNLINIEQIPAKKVQHNADQLLKTEDHSDIKHTQKSLFGQGETTALMTGKTSSISNQTPMQQYHASQFTLSILGDSEKTPVQFQSNASRTTRAQDTDEHGNRMSLLPSAKRPKAPSTKRKDVTLGTKDKKEIVTMSTTSEKNEEGTSQVKGAEEIATRKVETRQKNASQVKDKRSQDASDNGDHDFDQDDEDFEAKKKSLKKKSVKKADVKKSSTKTTAVGIKKTVTTKSLSKKYSGIQSKVKAQINQSESENQEEPKNPLDKLKSQVETLASSKDITKGQQQRTNFVKINMLKNYKPRMRGAAFSNKIMAKKRNVQKFRERMQRKMQIENAKNREQVDMYGGLGKVGLDHTIKGSSNEENGGLEIPGFSASALKYVKVMDEQDDQDDDHEVEEFLAEDLEEGLNDELQEIDQKVKEVESSDEEQQGEVNFDKPLYKKLPANDEEYVKILEKRFGHSSFKEGQLEALKILLEKKDNALVVLATGGGKSLVYQYASMFLPGLVLIVTPLISLMTDQLNKVPDFITAACLNSQQPWQMKRQIMQAVADKKIKVLFISPERFFIEDFSKFNRQISMVCVDEIHCASEWSHNFRPAYLKINDMIREKAGDQCVVLGLTATATKGTQRSICQIFGIEFPNHIVTQNDLSRLNLQLSITRDHEKQKALLQLLRSDSFKKLDSILIFATHKRTCELLAQFLTQNGINSQAYHAGKSDQQRQAIQKCFINNQIKALVCTIAFSMGIDKSDIQSVIHYDMPKSIENYVQEIGRAGRDGKLARCHLFLNNEDFFLIRRLIFTDLLDNYNALKLTNKIIIEAKRSLVKLIKPELMVTKKRNRKQLSKDDDGDKPLAIEDFEHESELSRYYHKDQETGIQRLTFDRVPNINPLRQYVFLDVKELASNMDLKREVLMTMLNSLEKMPPGKRFFRFEGVLPGYVGVRFHKSRPEEMAQKSEFMSKYVQLAKEHQGVFRCSMQRLAYELDISPFQIPKILYSMQNSGDDEITYDTDLECFVLKLVHIPYGGQTLDLSQEMLNETRRIERNMVQKLNCMYFVARRVSMPSIDNMLKREKNEDAKAMYMGFSKQLNDLINLYFSITNEDDLEVQIAGDAEERSIMMPLQYIDSHREKANLESEIKIILKEYHDAGQGTFDPNERMKPLDVVKILMGIYSDRGMIKRFMNNTKVWAKFQEYDYEDVYKVAQSVVNQFYLDFVSGVTTNSKDRASTYYQSLASKVTTTTAGGATHNEDKNIVNEDANDTTTSGGCGHVTKRRQINDD